MIIFRAQHLSQRPFEHFLTELAVVIGYKNFATQVTTEEVEVSLDSIVPRFFLFFSFKKKLPFSQYGTYASMLLRLLGLCGTSLMVDPSSEATVLKSVPSSKRIEFLCVLWFSISAIYQKVCFKKRDQEREETSAADPLHIMSWKDDMWPDIFSHQFAQTKLHTTYFGQLASLTPVSWSLLNKKDDELSATTKGVGRFSIKIQNQRRWRSKGCESTKL